MSFFSGSSPGRRPLTFTIPPPAATAAAATRDSRRRAQGELQGGWEGETPVPRQHRGGLSLPGQTTRRPFMQATAPPLNIPLHPHPPHLLIYTHKHSRTLVSPPAYTYTHTNAQWTLIEELVYYVCSASTTVGSRKMDDAGKVLVPSHINLITSLAVHFFSRWFFFLKEMQSCLNCLFRFHSEPIRKVILHACTFLFYNQKVYRSLSNSVTSSAVKVEDILLSLWIFFS